MVTSKEHVILVAEDNEHDAFLIERAFKVDNFKCRYHFVQDGQEAMDYFEGNGRFGTEKNFRCRLCSLWTLKCRA